MEFLPQDSYCTTQSQMGDIELDKRKEKIQLTDGSIPSHLIFFLESVSLPRQVSSIEIFRYRTIDIDHCRGVSHGLFDSREPGVMPTRPVPLLRDEKQVGPYSETLGNNHIE